MSLIAPVRDTIVLAVGVALALALADDVLESIVIAVAVFACGLTRALDVRAHDVVLPGTYIFIARNVLIWCQ